MDPQLANGWVTLARLQLQRDQVAAEQTLRRAVSALPDDGVLHQMLGNLLAGRGQSEEARVVLERAHELAPDDGTTLAVLGLLLAERGEDTRAIGLLSQAIRQGGGDAVVVFALFRSQLAIGDIRAAERSLIRLELVHPGSRQASAGRALFDQVTKYGRWAPDPSRLRPPIPNSCNRSTRCATDRCA